MKSQEEFIGLNSLLKLEEVLSRKDRKKIFLVTGKRSYELSGARTILKGILKGYNFTRFYNFGKNPDLQGVKAGIRLFKQGDYDMVIAIGGGSVIDMAKLINLLGVQPRNPELYIHKEKEISAPPGPLIAVPSTGGSGSQSTHFAVVYINGVKYSLAHPSILPTIAIVDPSLTYSLSPYQTAVSGFDAFSQAIESYWSVNSTNESKRYSTEALKLLELHLIATVNQASKDGRFALAKAAHLAGKAINIAKTTAAHAFSYPFTSYFGIPHGHAVGLTIGELFIYNNQLTEKDCLDRRGVTYVKRTLQELNSILGVIDVTESKGKIESIMNKIGLKTRLTELGINLEESKGILINNVNYERLKNNPRRCGANEYYQILQSIN